MAQKSKAVNAVLCNVIDDNFSVFFQHYASRSGHLAVCKFLLENGACASAQTPGGATPLHRSAYCGHLDVVRLLLHYRADPMLCDDDGASPLHKVDFP